MVLHVHCNRDNDTISECKDVRGTDFQNTNARLFIVSSRDRGVIIVCKLTCPLDDGLDPLESCLATLGCSFVVDWEGESCVDSWRMVGITLDDLLGRISTNKKIHSRRNEAPERKPWPKKGQYESELGNIHGYHTQAGNHSRIFYESNYYLVPSGRNTAFFKLAQGAKKLHLTQCCLCSLHFMLLLNHLPYLRLFSPPFIHYSMFTLS